MRINSVFDAARALAALRNRPADTYNTHAEDAASYKYTLYKQVGTVCAGFVCMFVLCKQVGAVCKKGAAQADGRHEGRHVP